jgi:hypothetical protein
MSVQLSAVIGANGEMQCCAFSLHQELTNFLWSTVYQASEAPVYKKANTALLTIVLFNLVCLIHDVALSATVLMSTLYC